jgi:GNAT superfamily N-acetyltransferase
MDIMQNIPTGEAAKRARGMAGCGSSCRLLRKRDRGLACRTFGTWASFAPEATTILEVWQIPMPAVTPLSLDEVTQSAEDPFATLNALLNEYNTGHVGLAKHVPIWLFARDASGKVQGGLRGQTYWSWCSIDVLTVAGAYRRQGIGSRLLAKAEEIARARGCVGIRLDTVSFQAPDFYRRHGYVEFGRIEGYPPGHTRLWFMKRF